MHNSQADLTVPVFQFDTRGNSAPGQNASLSEVHIFTPSVVNEARAGWHRFFEHEFFGSTDHPEFDAWRWHDYWVPLESVIDFKREVYRRALMELERYLHTRPHTRRERLYGWAHPEMPPSYANPAPSRG
jgi:hypothetical protein